MGRIELVADASTCGTSIPGNVRARRLDRQALDVGWPDRPGRGLRCPAAAGAVGRWGDVTVQTEVHRSAAVTLPQTPFPMPLVLATKLLGRG
ncbi:hypothetical protein [Actinoplanes sp. NPDC051411]|uniref:hypothetical protein n=1 Tax=Actinoplanes sp. NPDC051411 TaxID=3155522 RepID=UPI00341C7C45